MPRCFYKSSLGVFVFVGTAAVLGFIVGCGSSANSNLDPNSSTTESAPALNVAAAAVPPGTTQATTLDPLHPIVVIETTLGPLTVTLDAEKAPITVGNFLGYVQRGHYNGTIFHEVQKDFIAIAGAYTADLKERQTDFPIRNEAHNGLKNDRFSLAMARLPDAIDSATCHFFINLADNPNLNHKSEETAGYGYCVFGQVTKGQEVLEKLNQTATTAQADFPALPTASIAIQSIKRIK
jgi:peptidyl-prolyl cis-trans isomerase B (cyclophilin B)